MSKTCTWIFVSLFLLLISVNNGYGAVERTWLADTLDILEGQEYEASVNGRGLQAPNRAHGIRTYFTTHGIRVVDRSGTDPEGTGLLELDFVFLSRGQGSRENPPLPPFIKGGEVGDTIKEGRVGITIMEGEGNATIREEEGGVIHSTGRRVEVIREGLTEWYVNGAEGLEHGFYIVDRPEGEGELSLSLKVGLAKAFLSGDNIEFHTSAGRLLEYGKLRVFDKEGQALPAHFVVPDTDTVVLIVDDSEAIYPLTIDPLLTSPSWTVEGNQASARFGHSVATAGDVNRDGYSDVIIGAPYYDGGETDEGKVFVYYGSSSGLVTTPSRTLESNQAYTSFGYSVATAGDVNGDGYSDVIIGAPYYDGLRLTDEGMVYVYLGSSTGLSATPSWTKESSQAYSRFGYSVATADDVNKDGYSDVVVGGPYYDNGETDEGMIFVYHGSSTGLAASSSSSSEGNQASALLGFSVATAGDTNKDGYSDVIAGAPYYDNGETDEGRVYVYSGSSSGLQVVKPSLKEVNQSYARFGYSVAPAGDVNKDGYSDVIIGAPYYDNGEADEGMVHVYFGSSSGPGTSPSIVESNQASARFGHSVAVAGDVNGDGYSDVIVGAPFYDNGEADEGKAFVYTGSASGLSSASIWSAEGNQASAGWGNLGYSVAGAGDVNGDGSTDILVGLPYHDNGQADEGEALLYLTLLPDIQIDEFSFLLSQQGGYVAGDTVTAEMTLKTSVGIDDTPPAFDAKIEVVAMTPGYCIIVMGVERCFPAIERGTYTLGTVRVNASEVAQRGRSYFIWAYPQKVFTMSVSGGGFDSWASMHQDLDRILALRVTVDSSNEIGEGVSGESNNVFTSSDYFSLLPLTGELLFGSIHTTLSNPVIENTGCGTGQIRIVSGSLDWSPSADGGLWDTVSGVAVAGLCADPVLAGGGAAFNLVVTSGSVNVPSVTGRMGDLDVIVTGSILNNAGADPGSLRVTLPEGHSYHLSGASGIEPRGEGAIYFPDARVGPATTSDYSYLYATEEASGFIHITGLPFLIGIAKIRLDNAGIKGSYNNIVYVYNLNADYSDVVIKSNDHHFRNAAASQPASSFAINRDGMDINNITFDYGSGLSHFPQMSTGWGQFTVSMLNGRLTESYPGSREYAFSMSDDCPACQSDGMSHPRALRLTTLGTSGMGEDGSVTGSVVLNANPAWGPEHSSGQHIFERMNDTGKEGFVYLPGYRAVGTGGVLGTGSPVPVTRYLLGMRAIQSSGTYYMPGTHYSLTDHTSRLGNHFMAGVNVGPEYYSQGTDKLPVAGIGQSLSGTRTRIGFGGINNPDFEEVSNNAGTKYVIRPGGLTGVFNSDTPPQPYVYDYQLNLRRFAFRLVSNEMDAYSWIDGNIHVPNWADFDVFFSSLGIECSGHLSGGLVDRETCDDSVDNNGNGVTDENCNQSLHAWKTPVDILTVNFNPEPPAPGSSNDLCSGGGRLLHTGCVLRINALDDPIGLSVLWHPDGRPESGGIRITARTDHILDRPDNPAADDPATLEVEDENMGFPVAAGDVGMGWDPSSYEEGWFFLRGDVGVPFWEMIPVDTILENSDFDTQMQSIVVRHGTIPAGYLTVKPLRAIMAEEAKRPRAVYTWGATGFQLSLPVYYEEERHQDRRPRFLGKSVEKDLLVLNVKAITDFITPHETKMSFGASADIAALENLTGQIDLHVDLNDPESIRRLDNFLNNLGISGAPVGNAVGYVKDKLNLMNYVADAGFDALLEEAVRGGIEMAVNGLPEDPFAVLADKLGEVQAIPEMAANSVADSLKDLTGRLTMPLTGLLDQKMLDIYNGLPAKLEEASMTSTPDDTLRSQLDGFISKLSDCENALGGIEDVLAGLDVEFDRAKTEVMTTLNNVSTVAGDVQNKTNEIREVLEVASGLLSCGTSNDILMQTYEFKWRMRQVEDALSSINLVDTIGPVAEALDVDTGFLESAERDIHNLSEEIEERIYDLGSSLSRSLGCSETTVEVTAILDKVNTLLTQVGDAAGQIRSISGRLSAEGSDLDTTLNDIQGALDAAVTTVSIIHGNVGSLRRISEIARDYGSSGDFEDYEGGTADQIKGKIDELMLTATGSKYQWYYGDHTFVIEVANVLRDPIDTAINETAGLIGGELSSVTSLVPHPGRDELVNTVVDLIMNSDVVEQIDTTVMTYLSEIAEDLNVAGNMAFDQVNRVIQEIAVSIEGELNDVLEKANGAVKDFPVRTARMDGYATIAGNELERLHLGAEWTMRSDPSGEPSGESSDGSSGGSEGGSSRDTVSYNAALDVTSWSANGKAGGCAGSGDVSSLLDAVISTNAMTIWIGESEVKVQKLYLGFTIDGVTPIGLSGGISTEGDIEFESFILYDVAFASGAGLNEGYIGASCGAMFDDLQMKVAFLLGKTCNLDVIKGLDPQVGEFIPLSDKFQGVYARGSASIPVYDNGCALTVGVGADVGSWYLPPSSIGGLLGGSAYGEVICLASLRGSLTLMGQMSGGEYIFRGDGFVVGGGGFDCSPSTWTSVARSRDDDWCGTCDASFSASYRNGWNIGTPDPSCLH